MVVVVRKGHGKLVTETTSDPRQNSRPVSVTQTPGAITIGAQHGSPQSQPDNVPGMGGEEPRDVGPQARSARSMTRSQSTKARLRMPPQAPAAGGGITKTLARP